MKMKIFPNEHDINISWKIELLQLITKMNALKIPADGDSFYFRDSINY